MEQRTPTPWPREFTSRLSKGELILVLAYLPVHIVLLQRLFTRLVERGLLTEATANLAYYAAGFLYMLCAAFRFLRRDFDPLADALFRCVREALRGYIALLCCNLATELLFRLLPAAENPNNAAIARVVAQNRGAMKATLIYLAPFVEEMLFRAGIFGALRHRDRRAAYLVSAESVRAGVHERPELGVLEEVRLVRIDVDK